MRALAFALLLALPACAHAQTADAPASAPLTAEWRAVDDATGQIRDIEGLEQLAQDFPDSGNIRLRLLQPYMAAGEVEKVMATLEWLYDRGYVFSEVAQSQIPKLLEGVDPGRIAERLRAEAEVIQASEVIATVPAEAGLVESVFVYPGAPTVMVSSVSEEAIWSSTFGSKWAKSFSSDAGPLSGVVYEPISKSVWAAAGNLFNKDDSQAEAGKLVQVVSPLSSKRTLEAPTSKSLSDLIAGRNGSLYASDPIGGGVYYAEHGFQGLYPLILPGTLRSPQGLALSKDGKSLYVSDYRYGIAIVDLATRKVSRLASDTPVILDGVDGMWRHGDELIVVQNGTSPMRIAAFKLSEDGMRVVGHRVLEQANPQWTEPLNGSIHEGALYYVGNGQWDRYVQGQPAQDKPPLPTQIRRLSID